MATRLTRAVVLGLVVLGLSASPSFAVDPGPDSEQEVLAPDEKGAEQVPAVPPHIAPSSEQKYVLWPLQAVDETADNLAGWFGDRGFTISSGLSTAFQWDFNTPADFKVPFRSLVTNHSRYFVELFQLSLGYNPAPEPGEFGGNVVFDTGQIARRIKADWNGSGFVPDTEWEHDEAELQSAYVAYNVPIGNGLTLKGGKFVTLLGAEVIEPWLNPTFSRSFLFGYAVPFTHVGGYATYPITDIVSTTLGGVIGWDNVYDNNSSPSALGQVAVTPNDMFALYVNGIFGPEQTCAPNPGVLPTLEGMGCNSNYRGVVDVVMSITPPDVEGLSLLLNYAYGAEDEASLVNPGRHSVWTGFSGIVSFEAIPDYLTLALRGEYFDDPQGSRLRAANANLARPSSVDDIIGVSVWEVTFDAKVMLSDYIYLRGEYRHDEASHPIFTANPNTATQTSLWSGQNTVAVELGYFF